MRNAIRHSTRYMIPASLAVALLGAIPALRRRHVGVTVLLGVDPRGYVAAAASEGRYQLYGDGTSASPYYYVWVPAGATVLAPPPPPRRP